MNGSEIVAIVLNTYSSQTPSHLNHWLVFVQEVKLNKVHWNCIINPLHKWSASSIELYRIINRYLNFFLNINRKGLSQYVMIMFRKTADESNLHLCFCRK